MQRLLFRLVGLCVVVCHVTVPISAQGIQENWQNSPQLMGAPSRVRPGDADAQRAAEMVCVLFFAAEMVCVLFFASDMVCVLFFAAEMVCVLFFASDMVCVLFFAAEMVCVLFFAADMVCVLFFAAEMICVLFFAADMVCVLFFAAEMICVLFFAAEMICVLFFAAEMVCVLFFAAEFFLCRRIFHPSIFRYAGKWRPESAGLSIRTQWWIIPHKWSPALTGASGWAKPTKMKIIAQFHRHKAGHFR